MEINEEEAWKVLITIDPEEDGIDEVILRLRDRILKEFPLLDKKLRYQEWKSYLWEVGAENDKRVIQAREELEKVEEELHNLPMDPPNYQDKQRDFDIALDNLMGIKSVVVRELLKDDDKKLKHQKWQNYLWGVGAEEDKRVIQAREELEKFKEELGLPDYQFKQSDYYIALDNLMNIKRVVVKELLKE